jgi:hypothetical protein
MDELYKGRVEKNAFESGRECEALASACEEELIGRAFQISPATSSARVLNFRFLSEMASHEKASNTAPNLDRL